MSAHYLSTPSEGFTVHHLKHVSLPSQHLPYTDKGINSKALSKFISQLVGGIYRFYLNFTHLNLGSKPMVLYCNMFAPGCPY